MQTIISQHLLVYEFLNYTLSIYEIYGCIIFLQKLKKKNWGLSLVVFAFQTVEDYLRIGMYKALYILLLFNESKILKKMRTKIDTVIYERLSFHD